MTDGLEIPDKLSEWTKGGIVEHIGSDEEHTDTFYRHGNLGAEQDKDGTWEAYTIVDGHPIKVKGDMMSFEEVVEFFKGSFCSKRLADSDDEDDEDEDDDFDEDDEPEHPQGDEEIGVTFIFKSITEMMDEGYDGNAVKKANDLKQADKDAKKNNPNQVSFKNKAYTTNSVTKRRTRRGQVTLDQMHELNPYYIEGELGGKKGGNFKNEHSDEIRRRNKERADNNEQSGFEDDVYVGTGKNAYSNYIKSLFGADDPTYYKRGGVLRSMDDVYQLPQDSSKAPMIKTRGDKIGSYEGKPYSPKPFLTDNFTLAQMNDAIRRSFVKGHGQRTYSLDLPVIAGIDPTMLGKAYQLYTNEDDVGDLTGEPISVLSYGNMLNPHLFTYGTERSLHPVDLMRGQRRAKQFHDKYRDHGAPLEEARYSSAADLAKYLRDLTDRYISSGRSDRKYHDNYLEAFTHIPVKELISFYKDPKYADLHEPAGASAPRIYRGKAGMLEGVDDAVFRALENTNNPDIQAFLKYVRDNPEGWADSEAMVMSEVPPELYYPYQRTIRQLLDNATPAQRRFFMENHGAHLIGNAYKDRIDPRLLPLDMVNRGHKANLGDFKIDSMGNSTLPPEDKIAQLMRYDPINYPDENWEDKLKDFVSLYGYDGVPADFTQKQVEEFDKFHKDFEEKNGRPFDPTKDLKSLKQIRAYNETKIAADNYRAALSRSPNDPHWELYKGELEKIPLKGAHRDVIVGKTLSSQYGELNPNAEYTMEKKRRYGPVIPKAQPGLKSTGEFPAPFTLWKRSYNTDEINSSPFPALRRLYSTLSNRSQRTRIPLPEGIRDVIAPFAAQTDSEWAEALKKNPKFFDDRKKEVNEFIQANPHWGNIDTLFGSDASSISELDDRMAAANEYYGKKIKKNPDDEMAKSTLKAVLQNLDNQRAKFEKPESGAGLDKESNAPPEDTDDTNNKGEETINKSMMKSISVMIMEQMSGDLVEPCNQEPNLEILNEYPRSIIMGAGKVAIPDPQHVTAHDAYRTYAIKNFPENFPGNGE